MSPLLVPILVLVLLGAGSVQAGSILPTGNARSAVRALAGIDDGGPLIETEQAIDRLDPNPFDEEVRVTEVATGGDAMGVSALRTSATSMRIAAAGTASATASGSPTVSTTALGDTLFRYEFTVDEVTPFVLRITLTGTGGPSVSASFSEGSFGTSFDLGLESSRSFDVSGELQPGVFYFLSASSVAIANAGRALPDSAIEAGSFDLVFRVPEPGMLGLGALLAAARLRRPARSRHA
ncbi:MAG: hypothetical protein QNK05_10865 [Myxococcota bacterium]|nr:hypothetical protein [Myxococcota bacterium]